MRHTSEVFFPGVESMLLPDDWYRTGYKPKDRQATHEDLSVLAVYLLSRQGIIPAELAQDVAAVLCDSVRRGPKLRSLGAMARMLRALVSGEMDADRCDYLLRDSHFTGVSYGVYDLDRLVACQMVLPGPDGPELGLDVHGVHALEGLLMARYHMFLQVYFHKTPPAFEYYLEQAVRDGEIALDFALLTKIASARDPRMDAMEQSLRWISANTNLVPVGMVIGPFSLMTKLLADPITAVYIAGTGVTGADDPEIALLESVMELSLAVVLRNKYACPN